MIRLSARQDMPPELRGAIFALGNFDGVHLGHQKVIGQAIAIGRGMGRPVIVATFDPHPMRLFNPDAEPFRLTTLDQREAIFAELGADAMLVFEFDRALAGTSAADFVEMLMIDQLGAAGIVTGTDFTYGKGRAGSAATLAQSCEPLGCVYRSVTPVEAQGETVSSSRIRQALWDGNPQEAARLMTRPFAIKGPVVHGDKRGRTIGYPTANLELGSYVRPKFGIYAVTGRLPDGRMLKGAANLGVRPTFDPPKELLEPYFFDFSESLYDQEIEVAFHHFLRPEAKFDSLEELTKQMDADCTKARALLDG